MADEQLTLAGRALAVAAEQPAAVEVVYLRHYRAVYGYVLALTRSHDEAEDVSAEAFERAVRTWDERPPPAGGELPWLLLTARRLATDRWRRARRHALVLRRSALGGGTDNAHAGERATEFWLWFDALSKVLTARQREVLLLRYQRDLSDEEIGRVMGISASGVRSAASRALAVLRQHPELL